ncbi:MFS transporter [Cyanobium sp. ATX-6F1]|uniref:MFS transporter n=1 Tax=Cyanobium sp. ATX-6F1 TaxID=3137388 RepID=UPI0039BE3CE0
MKINLPLRLFPVDQVRRRFISHQDRTVTISVVFLALLNDRLSRSLVIPILPFLIGQANATGITIGLLVTSYSIASMIVNPFAGELCDRYGRRPLLIISLALAFVGMTLFGVAGALPLMFIGRLIDGLGGASGSISVTIISDVTPPKRKTEAFGLLSTAAAIAIVLGPGLGGVLAAHAPRLPIYIASLALFINAILALLFLPETINKRLLPKPRYQPLTIGTSPDATASKAPDFAASFKDSLVVFRQKRVVYASIAFTMVSISGYGILAVISLYMSKVLAWGPHQAGLVFSIAGLATVLQQFTIVGRLSRLYNTTQLLIIAHLQALTGLAVLLFPVFPSRAIDLVFSVTMITLALGLISPVIRALISESSGSRVSGSTMGMVQSMQNLGSSFGPTIVGLVYSSSSPGGSFSVFHCFCDCWIVFVAFLRSRFS